MKIQLIPIAAGIFSLVAVGGLAALRGVKSVLARGVLFVALCAGLLQGSLWLSRQWVLNAVELGIAWTVALVLVVVVEATTQPSDEFPRSSRSAHGRCG